MNRSISLTGPAGVLDGRQRGFPGRLERPVRRGHVAPCSTQRRRTAIWSAVNCLPLFLGGICRSGSSLSIRTTSSLSSGLPGTIARPPLFELGERARPWCRAAARPCAFGRPARGRRSSYPRGSAGRLSHSSPAERRCSLSCRRAHQLGLNSSLRARKTPPRFANSRAWQWWVGGRWWVDRARLAHEQNGSDRFDPAFIIRQPGQS